MAESDTAPPGEVHSLRDSIPWVHLGGGRVYNWQRQLVADFTTEERADYARACVNHHEELMRFAEKVASGVGAGALLQREAECLVEIIKKQMAVGV